MRELKKEDPMFLYERKDKKHLKVYLNILKRVFFFMKVDSVLEENIKVLGHFYLILLFGNSFKVDKKNFKVRISF